MLIFSKLFCILFNQLRLHLIIIQHFLRFMWQICACIPQSLEDTEELAELATKLTSAFFLETYIHAKERVSISHLFWVVLVFLLNFKFLVYFNAMDRLVN